VKNDTLKKSNGHHPMQPEEIKRLIEAGLSGSEAFVEGDGAHFLACVVSDVFAGKSRIEKQQIVYDTVRAQLLNGTLHALSVKAFTPEEWDKLDQKGDA
jgi:acid stress-induced BolA-like protein IbaG/YrbA